tara:strand:- start:2306 stop:2596 length:291 start_codon:yes stop_codon:yes gene_type:complete
MYLKTDPLMEEFEKILALSTGHLPTGNPMYLCFHPKGDYRQIAFEYGYVVWVSEYWDEAEDWFKPIMKYAYENNCTLILFDNAIAADEELFAVYDW